MTETSPSYDAWQITFFFSLLSNKGSAAVVSESIADGIAAATEAAETTLTATLRTNVAAALSNSSDQGLVGDDWTVTWGPSVYVAGPIAGSVDVFNLTANFTTTNAVFVVFSPSQNRYILAIAGTNFRSAYDWVVEDLTLSPGIDWQSALEGWKTGSNSKDGSLATPTLTLGTYNGVSDLLAMTDPTSSKTLLAYLQGLQLAEGQTLTVTGHSLGGALSPTLALALVDPTTPLTNLKASAVQVYPTAGATPGNDLFAQRFLKQLEPSGGSEPWQIWNAVLWNQFDIVPRAWTAVTMAALPAIYVKSGEYSVADVAPMAAGIAAALTKAGLFDLSFGPLTHLYPLNSTTMLNETVTPQNGFGWLGTAPNQQTPLVYTLPQAEAAGIPTDKLTAIPWLQQVIYQHIHAYQELILGAPPAPTGL